MRLAITTILLAGLAALPAVHQASAATPETVIKVSTMAPRTASSTLRAKKFNKEIAEATGGRVQFRTYYGGASGDERTVLRKIRAGQMDASPFGVDMVTNFVRQAAVLGAPRTFYNYKQVDAVRRDVAPEFEEEAYKNGFKVISWWDFGKVRMYSKHKIQTIDDLRKARPWLYPESPLLKAFYKMSDITGVPLGLGEVYGGLQTNMIDTVWISAIGAMALRWHTKTKYVSPPLGFIQGAFVVSRVTWDKLSTDDQEAIMAATKKNQKSFQHDIREQDEKTHRRLLQRGLSLAKFRKTEQWVAAGKKLRQMMVGRIYDKELLARVEGIAAKYDDKGSDILR